jgi:hypothetical protein
LIPIPLTVAVPLEHVQFGAPPFEVFTALPANPLLEMKVLNDGVPNAFPLTLEQLAVGSISCMRTSLVPDKVKATPAQVVQVTSFCA